MSLIEIILRVKNVARQSNVINAMWIEGSFATGKFNDESDIDVWLDIIPGRQEEALVDFKTAVLAVTELREVTNIHIYSEDPKLAKVKLYIKGMSDNNRIELDMQEASRDFMFNRNDDIVVLFDKAGAIQYGN